MKVYRTKYVPSSMKHWVMDYTNIAQPKFISSHDTIVQAEAKIKKLNLGQRELAR